MASEILLLMDLPPMDFPSMSCTIPSNPDSTIGATHP
jgi:hypothetical protein